VNGQEQVGLLLVGNCGTVLERHIAIVRSGCRQPRCPSFPRSRPQALGNIQHEFFLDDSAWAGRAVVVSTMTRIDHDPSNFQAQCAD